MKGFKHNSSSSPCLCFLVNAVTGSSTQAISFQSLSLSLPPSTIIKTTRTSRKIVNIQNYSIFSLQDVLSKKDYINTIDAENMVEKEASDKMKRWRESFARLLTCWQCIGRLHVTNSDTQWQYQFEESQWICAGQVAGLFLIRVQFQRDRIWSRETVSQCQTLKKCFMFCEIWPINDITAFSDASLCYTSG